ncbi:MAG: hypothetical protein AAF845_16870 [Bacteroidota bacterium]
MRRLAPLLLVLAACADDPPVAGPPSDPEAARLLEAVVPDMDASAFQDLARRPYTASVRVEVFDGAGEVVGTETATVEHTDGGTVARDRAVTGDLELREGPLVLRDPLPATVPEDPSYLDPAAREAYRFMARGDTTISGRRLRLAEAVLTDTDRTHAVQRVRAAVDPASGTAATVEITRAADAIVYDEDSRVRVDLWPTADGWLPRRVVTDTQTAVPFSEPRRVRTTWTVTHVDGRPFAPDTTGA